MEEVLGLELDVARTRLPTREDDGIIFDSQQVKAETIREHDGASGVRVTLRARLATAIEVFHVDINVGDPIWPPPMTVLLPRLRGGSIALLGYPMTRVLAEKTVTAMPRGTASTRWRDVADIYLLTGLHTFDAAEARRAITRGCRASAPPASTNVGLDTPSSVPGPECAVRGWERSIVPASVVLSSLPRLTNGCDDRTIHSDAPPCAHCPGSRRTERGLKEITTVGGAATRDPRAPSPSRPRRQ
jgi:hypothetical protein